MSKNIKITNLFKEKKKSNKRRNMKSTDGLDSDDEKFKEFESHEFKSQKVKFKYPKQKKIKPQKTLNDLIESKEPQENDSKSTQAFSKKLQNLLDEPILISDKGETKDIIMKDEYIKKTENNIFELSSKTKEILNQVMNKKKEEKKIRISNKENDSTILINEKSKNKGKKPYFQEKKNFSKIQIFYHRIYF